MSKLSSILANVGPKPWNDQGGWGMEDMNRSGERNKYKLLAILIHLVLLLLFTLPWIRYHVPVSGLQGIVVNFGEPDQGGEIASETAPAEMAQNEYKSEEAVAEVAGTSGAEAPQVQPSEPAPSASQPLLTDQDEDPVVEKEQARTERMRKAEQDRKQREMEAARAKEQAEREAAERAAEAERQKQEAEYRKTKQQYGDLFKGSGKESAKPGTTGEPNGREGEEVLSGLTTGAGRVGDGLGDRGVLYYPRIEDRSQKTGTVVIYICVDAQGKVEVARFTQKGSTTTDQHLVQLALETANKYRFTASTINSQCGTITFDFKVK